MFTLVNIETILESGIRMRYLSKYPHVIGGTSRFQNRENPKRSRDLPIFFVARIQSNQILKKQYWYSPLKYYPPVN